MAAVIKVGSRRIVSSDTLSHVALSDTGEAVVVSHSTGLLICRIDSSAWCRHVQDVMTGMYDSDSIVRDFNTHRVQRILVPVFPSDDIFATVDLAPSRVEDVMRAQLVPPLDSTVHKVEDVEFLGMLCKGEGRLQLRSLVIEVFKIEADELPANCDSPRHDRSRQRDMEMEFRTSNRKAIPHVWCYRWYHKCAMCFKEEGPGIRFDPDLIPSR